MCSSDLWDLPTDRFTVDAAFADAFGLDPGLGRSGLPLEQIIATVHPDDRAGLIAAIDEVISRGGPYAHQYRVRRADGKYYWLEANGRVEHDAQGMPLRFPGVLIDMEGHRAVEAERDLALRQRGPAPAAHHDARAQPLEECGRAVTAIPQDLGRTHLETKRRRGRLLAVAAQDEQQIGRAHV